MSKQKKSLVVGVLSSAAILFGVAGCGNGEADSATGTDAAQTTQAIQSNPNIPPQAKAAAAAAAQQGQAQGQAMAKNGSQ